MNREEEEEDKGKSIKVVSPKGKSVRHMALPFWLFEKSGSFDLSSMFELKEEEEEKGVGDNST